MMNTAHLYCSKVEKKYPKNHDDEEDKGDEHNG